MEDGMVSAKRLSLRFAFILLVLITLTLAVTPAAHKAAAAPQPGVIPGQYIVVFKDGVSVDSTTNAMAQQHGLGVMHTYHAALHGFAATIPDARLAAVKADSRVLFVSEDREIHAVGQSVPTGIDRIQADASSQLSGNGSGSVSGLAVAVIDTGIDLTHPDLNVVGGYNCSSGTSYKDGNGHGTHVSGTIGAKDDGNGVVGVAPGVPLYAVRVLNNAGSGSWSSVACGIDWVAANAASKGIKVASMSLGGTGSDDSNCGNSNNDALHKSICAAVAKGVVFVVAAGNETDDMKNHVPGAYNEVLTVTAIADFNGQPGGGAAATCRADVDETPADFSNWATLAADQAHTIAAPGVCILSTWKGGGYNTISGTSMATPAVSGVVALCLSSGKCSGSPSNIIAKLRQDAAAQTAAYGFTGDPRSQSGGKYYGYLVFAGGY
jgi:subtilisin